MFTRFFRTIIISIIFIFLLFGGTSFAIRGFDLDPPSNLKQNNSTAAGLWFNNNNVNFSMNKPTGDIFRNETGIGIDIYNLEQGTNSILTTPQDNTDFASVTAQALPDGKYRWRATTNSAWGNSDWVEFGGNAGTDMDFGIDTLAPDTTIEGGPLGYTGGIGSSGFVPRSINDQYLVTARGNDGSGSGVIKFKYRINPWWTYPTWYEYESASLLNNPLFGATFQLAPDATYTIEYRAVDQAGNEDLSLATRTFTVDGTPPTTQITSAPPEGSFMNASFTGNFGWSGDDGSGSGISHYLYKIDNSGWLQSTELTTEMGIMDEGAHTFQVKAVDNVGNQDPIPEVRNFTVDKTSPTGSITINNGAQYTNNLNVAINLSQVIDNYGLKDMQFDNNDGNWSTPLELFAPTKSWLLSAGDGLKTVRAYILDKANNPANFQDSITLDTTPPSTPSVTVPNSTSTVNSTSFNWTASTDTSSGLAGYEIERADDNNNSPKDSTWTSIASVSDSTLSYTDNNLQSNTRYWYRLKAKDQVNNYSVFTTPFKIATRADAPKNGVLNAVSPSQIDISWGSGGRQDRYHVYEWSQGLICVPAITSCSHTGLSPNTSYYYNIYGVNLEGQEAGGIIGVNTVTLPKSPDISSNRIIGGSFSDSQDVEFTTNIPFGNGSLAYYNYIWDQQPIWGNSLPSTWQNSDGLKLTLPANARGSWYLHIRSMNSAGQPGEAKDLGPYNYNNQAPVADAGGPYNIIWGNNLSLDGSKSSDADGDPLVFEWDVNNDNIFNEATGEKPVVNFDQQQAWFAGAGTYTIRLRVRDTFGLTHVGSTLVNIAANAPPQQINPTQPVQPVPLAKTSILLSAKPKVVRAGLWAKIAGKVKDSVGKALANVKVILKAKVQKSVKGKAKSVAKAKWITLAILTTNAKGEFVYKHKPKQTTIYKAEFAGNTSFNASSSKEVKVIVKKAKKKKKRK